jgi:predicted phage terminase large subunit-like protein
MSCAHLLCSLRQDGSCASAPPVETPSAGAKYTREELEGFLIQYRAWKARNSLAEFCRQAWNETDPGVPLKWNWHHEALCFHLERMIQEWFEQRHKDEPALTIQRLLINIPPGTAKSRIVSVFFPAWVWLHYPAWRVLCVSMNPKVAARDSVVCRNLIESRWYQEAFMPEWGASGDSDARDWFLNTAGGERRSFGFSAGVVGLRTDCIIVDDPNDPQEAYSEVMRTKVNETWDLALSNRLNDLRVGMVIGIQQRVHEDDWSNHVLKTGLFEHLRLPLLYEVTTDCFCVTCKRGETKFGWRDPRTEDGEVLHRVRFPEHVIENERAKGSFYFAGQFQQRPAPADGEVFKRSWFSTIDIDELPMLEDVLISIDAANSSQASKSNSNNALLVMGRKGPWRYVLEVVKGRWTLTELCNRIQELQTRWGQKTKRLVKILVEKKAMGPSVIDELRINRKMQGVIEDDLAQRAHDSKLARAMAVQPLVEGKNVQLIKGAPWADDFLHELTVFKGVGDLKDDQVDAFTMGLNYWRGSAAAERARMMATR